MAGAISEFGNLNRSTEYLIFTEVLAGTKTRQWSVSSLRHGAVLGRIQWYGPWRQFVFVAHDAIFNKGCLKDVENFLADAYVDWQRSKKS